MGLHVLTLLLWSNRKNLYFPLFSYFPWFCAWGGMYHHMLSISYIFWESWISFSFVNVQSVICTLWPDGHLFIHYTASLASLYRRIWMYWTSITLVRYILSSVCPRWSHFPQLSVLQYMVLCVFSLSIYLMMIVQIRVHYGIIIIKSEVWPICHYLGLGQETKVYVVCLPIFLLTASCMKVLLFA